MIELSRIKIDGGTQSRDQLNEDVVAEYAEAMKAGIQFPAVTVFYDGSSYWLADGFHRYFAAKKAGIPLINEEVTPGTLQDAQLFSYGVNANHGLRRSNADKRRAVTGALSHPVSSTWSDNQIAKHCGVHHSTVGDIRRSLADSASEKPADRTYTTKHGTTATMKTENIGKAPMIVPKPEVVSDELVALRAENERLKEWGSENASTAKELLEENASLTATFDANDQLAASVAENKRLRETNRILEERIRGLMNEKNEAIRLAKSWQRKYEQSVKAA